MNIRITRQIQRGKESFQNPGRNTRGKQKLRRVSWAYLFQFLTAKKNTTHFYNLKRRFNAVNFKETREIKSS